MKQRFICKIAEEIFRINPNNFWDQPKNSAAKPYLDAMLDLETIHGQYGADSAKTIVSYFLANVMQWKGEDARRIKAELNGMLKNAR